MVLQKKKVLVYGAGSLGSYLATKLYAAGHDVDVVGRQKAKDIGKYLYINEEKFDFPKVYDDLDSSKKYDYIFVTSKYYNLRSNLETIVNSGVRPGLIILIQNTYLDNSWYIQVIKNIPFVVASVYEGFNINKNKLTCKSYAGWFFEEDAFGKEVCNLLKDAGLQARLVDDLDVKRAEKTVINCASNIICALEQKTIKEANKNKENMKIAQGLFDESYDVLSEIIPMHSKRSLWTFFLQNVKDLDHYASTCQDVMRNKRTELSYLNGYIIELGRKMGIATPVTLDTVNRFRKKYHDLY